MNRCLTTYILALWIGSTMGCGNTHLAESPAAASGGTQALDTAQYLLTDEPDGAVGVITAREQARDEDEIVIVGRIGGRKNPWINGRAAFMLIDASMSVVADGEETVDGQVCMDDCCASLRAECTTLVKIVDGQGKALAIDARELLGAKAADMVVVKGIVQRDDQQGAFTIAANGVYVRR